MKALRPVLARVKRRLLAPLWRRRHVGAGSLVERSVHVLSWRHVRIGRNTVISGDSIFNVNNGHGPVRITVGDHVFVGRFCFFTNGQGIAIGDYALVGLGCRFLGAGHDVDPLRPRVTSSVPDRGRIAVGVNAWLGTDVTVLGDVSIGHGSVVGARALVTGDIPPFSVAVGTPARVTKRFDMGNRQWIPVQNFTPAMEALLPDEDSYRAALQAGFPSIPMPYAAAGPSRGDLA